MAITIVGDVTGNVSAVTLTNPAMEAPLHLVRNTRGWYTEVQAMHALGYTRCKHCNSRLPRDTSITRAPNWNLDIHVPRGFSIYCPMCGLGCAKVQLSDSNEYMYWDNFGRRNLAQGIASYFNSDANYEPVHVVRQDGLLGINWTMEAFTSLYPLGLMILTNIFGSSSAVLTGLGNQMGFMKAIFAPSPLYGYRNRWSIHPLINVRNAPSFPVRDSPSVSFTLYSGWLKVNHGFSDQDISNHATSITTAIRLLDRIYDPEESAPETLEAMRVVATALGFLRVNETFDGAEWNSKVQAVLAGFGGADKVLRRVKKVKA